jgi:sugar phosphate isomerase/epimerase
MIEFGLTPDSRWNIDVPELVSATRTAGFTALGIGADRIDETTATIFAAAGLRCHELLALLVTADETATLASAERLAQAAERIGAGWVLTVFRDALTSETAKTIERSAAMFVEAGAAMAVEFSPLGPVTSISAGLEIVDVAGAGRAGLLIDTWHFSFGESTWEDLERVPLEKIAYIQFDDAPPPESDNLMRETMHRRVMPGDGILELDRFASTLLRRGWDGLVSTEVLSGELRELPVPEFARRAYESSAQYWT